MKTLKYIMSLALVFFISCAEDDNDLSFVDSVVAPTNVSAFFQVTQDNTGLVTITPNSEGAVSYNITLGDDTTEPVAVAQGKNTQHTYAEGTYTVSIEAIGQTGLKTIVAKELVVSFKAPENLVVTIENDAAISKQVNVTATADFAMLFEVNFGDGSDPVQANIGEVASHNYLEAGLYTIIVTAMGAAIETTTYTEVDFEVTEILQPLASAPSQPSRVESDVISIFSSKYVDVAGTDYFPDWDQGSQGSSWALFDLNGDEMLQYINLSYQGIQIGSPVDVSTMEFIHMDVWTADEGLKMETSLISLTNGEKPVWSDLTANEWTSINIPISAFTDQGLTVADIHQLKFVGDPWAAGTVFIDNIYFWKEPSTAAPLLFDDFEGNSNITTWFGDAAGLNTALPNPYVNANNFSATVLEYTDTGGQYANVQFVADSKFDLTAGKSVFTLKIYVPSSSITGSQPNQISLKLQNSDLGGNSWQTQTEIIKPIVLDAWQVITFNFETDLFINLDVNSPDPVDRTDLDKVVIQVNSENNNDAVTAYIDDFKYGLAPQQETAPIVKDGFEGFGTITTWAGDNCGMDNAFANPFINANNNSPTVLEYNDAGGQYANVQFTVTPVFDLMVKSKFTLKIYVPSSSISGSQPNQISLKLQNSGLGGNSWQTQTEIIKSIVLDAWQTVTFDFVNDSFINLDVNSPDPVDRTDLDKVVLQVNSENNNDTVIAYIDDFNYHN